MLSAQCTDVKVNMVTPALFAAYPDAKAKNLVLMARELTARFGGEVPADHDALESLPGVGRKTANVVMSCAFGADAIAVDTHVFRVANRLGLADAPDVLKTEHQLMQNIPQSQWSRAHHWLIYHGRRVCAARKPACESCTLRAWCEYANGNPKGNTYAGCVRRRDSPPTSQNHSQNKNKPALKPPRAVESKDIRFI